jgi:uncharacterized protein (DUF2345 family)
MEVRTAGGGYEIANTAAGSRIGMNEAGQIYIIGPSDFFVHAGGDLKFVAGGNIDFEAAGTMSGKASDFKFDQ